MADITLYDLGNRYHPNNIIKYADLDNSGEMNWPPVNTDVITRINAAIAYASGYFYDRMRASIYARQTSLLDSSGNVPATVVDCQVKLAGYWLSTARGVKGFDKEGNPLTPLYGDLQDALRMIKEIQDQVLKLDVPTL